MFKYVSLLSSNQQHHTPGPLIIQPNWFPFDPGLEPSRLRGGAESPWKLSSANSGSKSSHEVPISESLRPIEPSRDESPGDAALLGVETAPVPLTLPSSLRDEMLAAPARKGLNGTARMLSCRSVEAPAVLAGVLGVLGHAGLGPWPSPLMRSRSCASVSDVGTGGTGLVLLPDDDPGVAAPGAVALARRKVLSRVGATLSPTLVVACR